MEGEKGIGRPPGKEKKSSLSRGDGGGNPFNLKAGKKDPTNCRAAR